LSAKNTAKERNLESGVRELEMKYSFKHIVILSHFVLRYNI